MLERIWRRRAPLYTIDENVNSEDTMENSIEVPQKTKNRTTMDPYDPIIPLLFPVSSFHFEKMNTLIFFLIFKLYITVLDLPNIKINPPQVY